MMSGARFLRSRLAQAVTRNAIVSFTLAGLVLATAGMAYWARKSYAAQMRAEATATQQTNALHQVMAKLSRIESAVRRQSSRSSMLETQMASIQRQNTALAAFDMHAPSAIAHAELAAERLREPGPEPQLSLSSTSTTAAQAVLQTQVCVDGDLGGTGDLKEKTEADVQGDGNLGVEVYGNGGEAKVQAKEDGGLDISLGGGLGVSVHRCLQFNTFGILGNLATTAVDNMVAAVDNGQVDMVNGLVNTFNEFQQFGNKTVTSGLKALSGMQPAISPQQLLTDLDNPQNDYQQYTSLIDSLPLPTSVQNLLTNPTSLLPDPSLLSPGNMCTNSTNTSGLLGTICAEVPSNLGSSSGILGAISQLSNVQGALTNFQASLGNFKTGATELCNSVTGMVTRLNSGLTIPGGAVPVPSGINYTPPSLTFNGLIPNGINAPPPTLAFHNVNVGSVTLKDPFQLPAIACPSF